MNIMKHTFIFKTALLFAALAIYSGHELRAQNMTEPYKIENGIAYKKSVSQTPNEKGEYTVRIETFVTGEVSQKQKPIPADIVLVLDVSGSMSYPYSPADEYIETSSQGWSYNSLTGYGSGERYYLYEGNYNLVQANYYYNSQRDWGYYLYFNIGNQTYYLNGTGVGERPSRIQNNNTTIYTGTLYRKTTTTTNRLEALQDAVEKFINVVKAKDSELKLKTGQVGNRVAIVKFAGDSYTGTKAEGDDTYRDGSNTYNYTQVVKEFHPVATDSQELIDAVNDFTAAGATSVDYGLTKAHDLILNDGLPIIDENGETIRSRTVVVFTDGNPTHSNYFQYAVAASAVRTAKSIKATEGEGVCSAKVFTVGVFGDDIDPATDEYMQRVSSNYEDADYTTYTENQANWQGNITRRGSITYTGEPISQVDDELIYSIIVGNDKGLDEVFESIADISSGQNTAVGDESVMTLDVVSNSFKLPDGVTKDQIHVYTAQCLGLEVKEDGTPWLDEDGNQYLAFADPIEATDRPKVDVLWVRRIVTDSEGNPVVVDGKIQYEWYKLGGDDGYDIDQKIDFTFTEGADDNSVSVTGFNYSDYWCGLDEDHENTEQYVVTDYPDTYVKGYRGFKLILEFPIIVQPDAVGGPEVVTNGEDSGIFLTDEEGNPVGEPLIRFNRPNIKIPVQIWLQKTGLKEDDSAVFTIRRYKFKGADFDYSSVPNSQWETFTKIAVNKHNMDANGIVRISGLDPDYVYKLQEDAWGGFGYSFQDKGIKYTVGDNVQNPFEFVNTPKEVIFDEATVRNVFKKKEGETTTGTETK